MKTADKDTLFHVRRCHICGTVNELENQAVRQCRCCGKHLAPFYYYDESESKGIEANGLCFSVIKKYDPETQVETFKPLIGLSTYWDETR